VHMSWTMMSMRFDEIWMEAKASCMNGKDRNDNVAPCNIEGGADVASSLLSIHMMLTRKGGLCGCDNPYDAKLGLLGDSIPHPGRPIAETQRSHQGIYELSLTA
jgi:hypothetical protein